MTEEGVYSDPSARGGYALPPNLQPTSRNVLTAAHDQALAALLDPQCRDDLASYYNPAGRYAGTLFLDVEPNDPNAVEASDLYALTTLSISLDSRHGRLLLGAGDIRSGVNRQLRGSLNPSCRSLTLSMETAAVQGPRSGCTSFTPGFGICSRAKVRAG